MNVETCVSGPTRRQIDDRNKRVNAVLDKASHLGFSTIQRELAEAVVDLKDETLPAARMCKALIAITAKLDRQDSLNVQLNARLDAVLRSLSDDHASAREIVGHR